MKSGKRRHKRHSSRKAARKPSSEPSSGASSAPAGALDFERAAVRPGDFKDASGKALVGELVKFLYPEWRNIGKGEPLIRKLPNPPPPHEWDFASILSRIRKVKGTATIGNETFPMTAEIERWPNLSEVILYEYMREVGPLYRARHEHLVLCATPMPRRDKAAIWNSRWAMNERQLFFIWKMLDLHFPLPSSHRGVWRALASRDEPSVVRIEDERHFAEMFHRPGWVVVAFDAFGNAKRMADEFERHLPRWRESTERENVETFSAPFGGAHYQHASKEKFGAETGKGPKVHLAMLRDLIAYRLVDCAEMSLADAKDFASKVPGGLRFSGDALDLHRYRRNAKAALGKLRLGLPED
jgi:hypothetical protein